MIDISWNCIGSTEYVDASENALVGDTTVARHGQPAYPNFKGVYRLDGGKVADDYTHMWGTYGTNGNDGRQLLRPMNRNQNGVVQLPSNHGMAREDSVWAGTWYQGHASSNALGDSHTSAGAFSETSHKWITDMTTQNVGQVLPFYALSEVLTWPSVTRLPGYDSVYGLHNFGTDFSGRTGDISFNTQDLSNNGFVWEIPQQFTVRGFCVFQDTSSTHHIVYTNLSENFFTHVPPIIDISNTIDPSGVPDGYVTAGWWADVSQNFQEDILACGFVWKAWDGNNPPPDSGMNIADASSVNIFTTFDNQTDTSFNFYTVGGLPDAFGVPSTISDASGLLLRDTSYTIMAYWQYQDTPSNTVTLYSDASTNFHTHAPPTSDCSNVITNIGDAFATVHGKILTNPQKDIIEHGFCWGQSPNPTIDNSFNDLNSDTSGIH